MQFDGRLGSSEMCPRKNGKAQIDGSGVEGIDRVVEF
jgi:hypothetical protein